MLISEEGSQGRPKHGRQTTPKDRPRAKVVTGVCREESSVSSLLSSDVVMAEVAVMTPISEQASL